MTRRKTPGSNAHLRLWQREHGVTCWTHHDECALRAAIALMETRIHHCTSRRDLFRNGLRWRGDDELVREALAVARRVLGEAHEHSWKAEEATS